MGFSRQEYWSGLPFPSPGDLPNPGIKPRSPALQADSLPAEPPGKPASWYKWTSLVAQMVKRLPAMWKTRVRSLGWEVPLEKETATHSSILAWKIPWMEEPGRLQSKGSQRVRHNWVILLHFSKLEYNRWTDKKGARSSIYCPHKLHTQEPALPIFPFPLYPGNCLSVLSVWICFFWTFHINGVILHEAFCIWLL